MTPYEHRQAMPMLAEVWGLSPDVRLGLLIAHLGILGEAHIGRGRGAIEDDKLMAVPGRHRAELVARADGSPDPAPQRTGSATSVSGSPMPMEAAPAAELAC